MLLTIRSQALLMSGLFVSVAVVGLPHAAKAGACASNTDVNSDCTDLQLTSANSEININATVTATGDAAVTLPYTFRGTDTLNVNSGGEVIGGASADGIDNYSSTGIGTLNNYGTISGTVGVNNAVLLYPKAAIGTINNFGTISGTTLAIKNDAQSIWIGAINNTGTISRVGVSTESAIYNTGHIGSIVNAGTISSNGNYAISNDGRGTGGIATINEIVNYSTITGAFAGIYNHKDYSTIKMLANGGSNLTYEGRLPTNYNIILNGASDYGKTTFISPVGVTNFGIDNASYLDGTIGNYTGVIEGLTASNFASTTGTYGGGLLLTTWTLSNSSGTTWDLSTVTQHSKVDTGSTSGNKLADAIVTTYNNTVTPPVTTPPVTPPPTTTPPTTTPPDTTPPDTTPPETPPSVSKPAAPTLTDGVTPVATAVHGLTPAEVTNLGSVHPEGYVSNLALGLMHLNGLSENTMSRLRQKAGLHEEGEDNQYFWIDAITASGKLLANQNHFGFDYNLKYLTMGVDIFSENARTLGIFGGIGQHGLRKSGQLQQAFDTTDYFAGLYGMAESNNGTALSWMASYAYGDNDARRYNPNFGLFPAVRPSAVLAHMASTPPFSSQIVLNWPMP